MHKKEKKVTSCLKSSIGSLDQTNNKPLKVDFICPRPKRQGRHLSTSRHFENRHGEGPGDEKVTVSRRGGGGGNNSGKVKRRMFTRRKKLFFRLVNMRRFISLPDFFPPGPTNCPWVSEDGGCVAILSPRTQYSSEQASHSKTPQAREIPFRI